MLSSICWVAYTAVCQLTHDFRPQPCIINSIHRGEVEMKVRVLLTAVLLAVASIASAEEVKQNTNTQQQLSKRPYAAPAVDKETFDGAVVDKKEVEKPTHLNLHMLGKRPFMEKATD